jgi:hypothetical protein
MLIEQWFGQMIPAAVRKMIEAYGEMLAIALR